MSVVFPADVFANYTAAVLTSSPNAFWQMQEVSGLPADSSVNNLPMTAASGTATQYRAPGALGNDCSILCNISSSFNRAFVMNVTTNFTVEMWVNQSSVIGTNAWFYSQGTPASSNGWAVGLNSGKMSAVAHNAAILSDGIQTTIAGNWYHLVWQRAASIWSYWINGVIDRANAGTTSPSATSGSCYINGVATGATQNNARIAHVAIWDRLITASEIQTHYAAGARDAYRYGPFVPSGKGSGW